MGVTRNGRRYDHAPNLVRLDSSCGCRCLEECAVTQVIPNFKPPKDPNKPKKERAAAKRPGMSPEHLALIRQLPSCISGRRPCDPHHLKVKDERGVGLRATDRWAVPLARDEHDHLESFGSRKELWWFKSHGIENPYDLANALWKNTGDLERMEKIVEAHREGIRNG